MDRTQSESSILHVILVSGALHRRTTQLYLYRCNAQPRSGLITLTTSSGCLRSAATRHRQLSVEACSSPSPYILEQQPSAP
jgi:hypothetical protein